MSRQAKKRRLVIEPDEVSGAPGAPEAAEIRGLYETAKQGMQAFVMMGFRLIEVKSRLKHGEYMRWIERNIGDLRTRQLHNSRMIAEGLILQGYVKLATVANLETLPPEVCDLIDGKSGRALLSELREPLSADQEKVEAASKELCEAIWQENPQKRDDWEPRVLAGEITYHKAHVGILGAAATQEKEKHDREIWDIFDSKLCGMNAPFKKMDKIIRVEPGLRESLVKQIRGWAKMEMTPALLAVWKDALNPLELSETENGEEAVDGDS